MKRIFSMFMVILLLIGIIPMAMADNFTDTETIVQSVAIDTVETLGIVEGYEDGTFHPYEVLSRAELCTMLTRALYGDVIYTASNAFKDVTTTHWAKDYIETAYANGLMEGYGNGEFGPNDDITYVQMAAVILKALGYDVSKIVWPTGVFNLASNLGLYENVSVRAYTDGCTRADAAQIIYNAFDLHYVTHVSDYPVEHVNRTFLTDGLGFTKSTVVKEDGNVYISYIDLLGNVYETEQCVSTTQTIYLSSRGTHYGFSKSTKTYEIDWISYDREGEVKDGTVTLYVNDYEIIEKSRRPEGRKMFDGFYRDEEHPVRYAIDYTNSLANYINNYFDEYDVYNNEAIGVFDEDGTLISIRVYNDGKDYIPGNHTSLGSKIGTRAWNALVRSSDYNSYTSTITYFSESEDYEVSNKIAYGWITDIDTNNNILELNDESYPITEDMLHDIIYEYWMIDRPTIAYDDIFKYAWWIDYDYNTYYNINAYRTFVVLYYNYADEIVGYATYYGEDVFRYDINHNTYHTIDCFYENEVYNSSTRYVWKTEAEVKDYIFSNLDVDSVTFYSRCNCGWWWDQTGRTISIVRPVEPTPEYVSGIATIVRNDNDEVISITVNDVTYTLADDCGHNNRDNIAFVDGVKVELTVVDGEITYFEFWLAEVDTPEEEENTPTEPTSETTESPEGSDASSTDE